MLKKTVLTFAFLSILTTFYGFNAPLDVPEAKELPAPLAAAAEPVAAPKLISDYDGIIRSISEREGHDWRLMSAIAYHESRFKPDLTSRSGARGMMQIMPSVARHFDVPQEQVDDLETNIWLANRLLSEIQRMLRIPAGVSAEDRMSLALAAYNGGIGHVSDARRLARAYGEDHNSWEVVARYLALKAQPEYYEHEAVRCGRFTGSGQTLAYVRDVMKRYDRYCRIAGR